MSTQKASSSEKISLKMNSKLIKAKTQEFLSSRRKLQPLNDILNEFEVSKLILNVFEKKNHSLRLGVVCNTMMSYYKWSVRW